MVKETWAEAFNDDEILLKKVKETIDDTRKHLAKKYREMGLGEAFYRGDHYGEWSDESLSWRDEDINEDDRPRIVSNQVKVYVDKAVTKITRYKPSIMTTPMGTEETDVKGSKVGEQMLHHMFKKQDMDDIQERWVKNSANAGIGWMKVDFNPFLEEEIEDLDEKKLADGVELRIEKDTIYKGEIEYTLPNPMNIIPDLIDVDFKKHRYLIEEMLIPHDTLTANYKKAKDLKKDNSFLATKKKSTDKALENMVRCWLIYFKPCPELKKGAYAIGTEEKVLDIIQPYPKDHKKLPYIPLIFSSDDECMWGQGVPQPLVPLQVEYNKIRNIRVENQNYASAIKFLNPLGSGYDADLMTNEPGEVIDYEGSNAPGWSQPQSTSQELTDSLAEIKQEMQDISMVSATSQGRPPEGTRSGIMLQYLIENDDAAFAPIIRRMESGIVDLCYLTLEEMQQNYEDEDDRFYKVIGPNKEYQLKKFKKTSLNGEYDIIIQNSNANPLSKAYKMDTIMQLIQYQMLNQNDRPFIAEALEVGNIKGVYEDTQVDRLRAQKEIEKIIEGKPHEIMEYDDDDEHISTKVRYLKSEYDNLSQKQRAMLSEAIKAHEEQKAMKTPAPPQESLPPEAAPPAGGMI